MKPIISAGTVQGTREATLNKRVTHFSMNSTGAKKEGSRLPSHATFQRVILKMSSFAKVKLSAY